MDLQGKVAMVTGASRGLGRVIAEELAKQGASVAIISSPRSRELLEQVRDGLSGQNHLAISGDFSQEGEPRRVVEEVIKHYGRVDILVNNAGSFALANFVDEHGSGDFDRRTQLNYSAPAEAMATALRQMETQQEGGAVVNISSSAASKRYPRQAGYVGSKSGLSGLSVSVAGEYSQRSLPIKVHAVESGSIDTPMYRKAIEFEGKQVGYEGLPSEEQAKFHREIKTAKNVANVVVDILVTPETYKDPIVPIKSYEF